MLLRDLWKQVQISENSVDITIHGAFTIEADFLCEKCTETAANFGVLIGNRAPAQGTRAGYESVSG